MGLTCGRGCCLAHEQLQLQTDTEAELVRNKISHSNASAASNADADTSATSNAKGNTGNSNSSSGGSSSSRKKPLSPTAMEETQAPSKRAKELQLTQEEAGLKGAPEGAVYEVSVLLAEQIEPSKEPEAEMQHALQMVEADANGDNWAEQHMAVDSIRRMAIHHSDALRPHMPDAVRVVLNTITSLRSSMVRNALLAVKDLFEHVEDAMGPFTEEIIAAVLRKSSGDKKFISEAAVATLAAVAQKGEFQPAVNGLAAGAESKNAEISAHALKALDDLTTRFFRKSMLRQLVLGSGESSCVKILLDALVAGLNSRNPAGKAAARATLRKLRQSLTPEVFEQKARELLADNEAEEVLREATRPAAGASKSMPSMNRNVSIKDRILAAQKQQASMREPGSQSSNGEVVVEFKTKDQPPMMMKGDV